MGYFILWCAHLSSTLMFVAWVFSFCFTAPKKIWRMAGAGLGAILGLAGAAGFTASGIMLWVQNIQPKWLLGYGVCLFAAGLSGTIWLYRAGLKKTRENLPAYRSWSRGRLFAGAICSVFIYYLALGLLENRVVIHTNLVHREASARLSRLLPARLPDEMNAKLLFDRAAGLVRNDTSFEQIKSNMLSLGFDPRTSRINKILNRLSPAMAIAKKASMLPGFQLNVSGIDYHDWPTMPISAYRDLGFLFVLRARHHAVNKRPESAFEDLKTLERICSQFRQFPTLISFMMAQAIDRNRLAALEVVLSHSTLPETLFQALPLPLPRSVKTEFFNGLKVEFWGQLQGISSMAASVSNILATHDLPPVIPLDTTWRTRIWRVFFLPDDLAALQKITHEATRDADTYARIAKGLSGIRKMQDSGKLGIFSGIALPNYSRYIERARVYDVQRNLEILALAATAFKIRESKYPETIEALVPRYLEQVPMDPFAPDRPFTLKLLDGGMVIQSAGPKEKDIKDDPYLSVTLSL